MREEDEWLLETSHVPKHRLKEAAVENRLAVIRGIPHVAEEDAAVAAAMEREIDEELVAKAQAEHDQRTDVGGGSGTVRISSAFACV